MVLLLRKLYLYFTKDPGGSIIFQAGGGSNFLLYHSPASNHNCQALICQD